MSFKELNNVLYGIYFGEGSIFALIGLICYALFKGRNAFRD